MNPQIPEYVWVDDQKLERASNVSAMAYLLFDQNTNLNVPKCWRLSGSTKETSFKQTDLIKYELISESDPAFGVAVHYYFGEYVWSTFNHELIIKFVCDQRGNDRLPSTGIFFFYLFFK